VRLITLNYARWAARSVRHNFLHEAEGSVASIARLEADECVTMIERIMAAHPAGPRSYFRTIIFTFTRERRILPLSRESLRRSRMAGSGAPAIISTNRIDAIVDRAA